MDSLVSIAQIDMIEESKTFVFSRGTSTHTGIFYISGTGVNNHTLPYSTTISHFLIAKSDHIKMPVCVLVPLEKTKVLLSSIISI
jgi:hypothetical protein